MRFAEAREVKQHQHECENTGAILGSPTKLNMTVLSYGEIDLDIYIKLDRLPTMERSGRAIDDFENIGGAAANSGIWLANWGIPTRLAGHDLGDDRAGDAVRELLSQHPQLDTSFIASHKGYRTPRCQCLVTPDGERSFITHWLDEMRIAEATPEMLDDVHWLNLDMSGPWEPRLRTAQLAKDQGIPVLINDIYDPDHDLLPLVSVLVISAAVIRNRHKSHDPLRLARKLSQYGKRAVILTDAAAPLTVLGYDEKETRIQPPAVDAVDTTGAGDTFKAGLLYGLMKGMSMIEAARWGCAAASLMCALPGTTRHLASVTEVEAMLPKIKIL